MLFKVKLLAILVSYSVFLGLSHVYIWFNLRCGIAISINKDVPVISSFDPPNVKFWASSVIRKENDACYLAVIKLQSLPAVSTKEKCRRPAPDSWGAYQGNDVHEPRHIFQYIEITTFLNLGYLCSLNHNNVLMFRLPAPCFKLLHNLTPPPPEQFLWGYMRHCLPALKP